MDSVSNVPISMNQAHSEWSSRPADERFETLEALHKSVDARAKASLEYTIDARSLKALPRGEEGISIVSSESGPTVPSHWAFGQVATRAGAPSSYLRKLSPQLATDCINYGIAKLPQDEKATKLLVLDPAEDAPSDTLPALRSATSPSYGRIWDTQAVALAREIREKTGGIFYNPKEWSGRGSGLYASDHDVFIFMIDGGSIVDGQSERDTLHRGFFIWNSEVGSATFGIQTFLFRAVCGNHLIWNPEQVKALRIRHTAGAPDRFVMEAAPKLLAYVNQSTDAYQKSIAAAKAFETPRDNDDAITFLKSKGFTNAESRRAIAAADREEGGHGNLWLLVQGLTASARDMAYIDARVDLETRAGKLLEAIAA